MRKDFVRMGFVSGLAALVLSGCSALGPLGGGESASSTSGRPPGLSPGFLTGVFGPVQVAPAAAVQTGPIAVRCPRVDVREGTEVLRTFDGGAGGDDSRLRWQATISETARECRSYPEEAQYVVGVAGRLVLGPRGAAGTYQVPIRVAVLRGDQVLESRLLRAPVTIGPGETQGVFSLAVDDIRVRRQPDEEIGNLQLIVGFDPGPERPQRPQRRRQAG